MIPEQPATKIRALISGFPGERGRQRQMLMLQNYQFYVDLAGYIAPALAWERFAVNWQTKLNEANLGCFQMHEMAGKPEIAGWFYRTIEEHNIIAAVSCVVHTKELVKVVRSISWPTYKGFRKPLLFCIPGNYPCARSASI